MLERGSAVPHTSFPPTSSSSRRDCISSEMGLLQASTSCSTSTSRLASQHGLQSRCSTRGAAGGLARGLSASYLRRAAAAALPRDSEQLITSQILPPKATLQQVSIDASIELDASYSDDEDFAKPSYRGEQQGD
jgi:hypothetical protein